MSMESADICGTMGPQPASYAVLILHIICGVVRHMRNRRPLSIIIGLLVSMLVVTCAVQAATVDPALVSTVIAYGAANTDEDTGLVKNTLGQPNLAESTPGYIAALLIEGGHDAQAKAALAAVLANQDSDPDSATSGNFRWYGGQSQPFSYDATLYALPPLAWVLRNHGQQLGTAAPVLEASVRAAAEAVKRQLVGPESEAYLMLQAASLASSGAALNDPKLVSTANDLIIKWLDFTQKNGLPEGHSPTFDSLRLAAMYWVKDALTEPSPKLDLAIRLARADMGLRLWQPTSKTAGAVLRGFPNDYLPGESVTHYVISGYFGIGQISDPDPFAMYFLLPSTVEIISAVAPEMPYQIDTRSTPEAPAEASSTYMSEDFTLGTMSGTIQANAVPLLVRFADFRTGPPLYAQAIPAPCHVSSVQKDGVALLSFDFDRIGYGRNKQAYVDISIGNAKDIDGIYVRGAEWNREPTGLGTREVVAVDTRGCYVGIVMGRSGPVEGAADLRIKPGKLFWTGKGELTRLSLEVYGRQSEYAAKKPIDDVRVTFAIATVPKSAYASLEEFAAACAAARIKDSITNEKVEIQKDDKRPVRKPNEGIIPAAREKDHAAYRYYVKQQLTATILGQYLELVEDLRAGELLTATTVQPVQPADPAAEVTAEEPTPRYLWNAPNFKYAPDMDLSEALAAGGM